jgi:hypothetical protein
MPEACARSIRARLVRVDAVRLGGIGQGCEQALFG